MKMVRMNRTPCTDEGTFSVLLFGDKILQATELPWRDNQPSISCIPKGTYTCALVVSPRFGRVYGVQDVPGRSHILIHAANFGGDVAKGYQSHLEGCIAPSLRTAFLNNDKGVSQRAGMESRAALKVLMDWAAGDPFQLVIA